jgi:hypothetical protein
MPSKRGKNKAPKLSPSTSCQAKREGQVPAKFEADPLEAQTVEQPINGLAEMQLSVSELLPEAAERSEPRAEDSEVGPGQGQPVPSVTYLVAQNESLRKEIQDLKKQLKESREEHALAIAIAGDGLKAHLEAVHEFESRMTALWEQQLDVDKRRKIAWSSVKAVLCDVNALAQGVQGQGR